MTVVVACTHDLAALDGCMRTLAGCCGAAGAEIIAVAAKPPAELEGSVREFPSVTFVSAEAGTPIQELRRMGLARASRNLVVFVDDNATERHQWTATFCAEWRAWADGGGRVGAHTCGPMLSVALPRLSVVMPVRNGGANFALALESMLLSDLPRNQWELVVVNDASTDATDTIAASVADKLVRLPAPAHGPGYARNRGFETTLGDYIAFVNADVMVRPDTLRRAVTRLMESREVGAVVGCYDGSPRAKGFVSQYRNLLQHHYMRCTAGDRFTFSSACGVIRSDVFEEAGGYDEWHFSRRQLEDLELGQHIRSLGYRIVLDPDLEATNLKTWTLRSLISTEIFDRGVPRMRLVRRHVEPVDPAARRRRIVKNVNAALTWASLAFAVAAARFRHPVLLLPAALCVVAIAMANRAQLAFFRHARGMRFSAMTFGLDLIYYLAAGIGFVAGWVARETVGEPRPGPSAEAFAEMGVKRWPPVPARRALPPRRAENASTFPADGLTGSREQPLGTDLLTPGEGPRQLRSDMHE